MLFVYKPSIKSQVSKTLNQSPSLGLSFRLLALSACIVTCHSIWPCDYVILGECGSDRWVSAKIDVLQQWSYIFLALTQMVGTRSLEISFTILWKLSYFVQNIRLHNHKIMHFHQEHCSWGICQSGLRLIITWLAWLSLWWFLQCMKNHA